MNFLASANIEEANSFSGKLQIPNEEGKKPHQVLLNVVVTDDPSWQGKVTGKEKCVTLKSPMPVPVSIPDTMKGKVFYETSMEELGTVMSETIPEGLVVLARLSDDFSNMRKVWDCSRKYSDVRFIGGNLLAIPGIKIGRFDSKHKSIVCNGVYDDFIEVNLSELDNIQEVVKKVKVKVVDGEEVISKKRKGERKPKKEKKPDKRVAALNSLFGAETVEF